MRYDIELIHELCQELGFSSRIATPTEVAIELAPDVVLRFINNDRDDDCLAGFDNADSHVHGDFMFWDAQSHIKIDYLDILTGLKDGEILICESWKAGELKDRWLIHREFNNEFEYVEEGEEIRVRRFPVGSVADRP